MEGREQEKKYLRSLIKTSNMEKHAVRLTCGCLGHAAVPHPTAQSVSCLPLPPKA